MWNKKSNNSKQILIKIIQRLQKEYSCFINRASYKEADAIWQAINLIKKEFYDGSFSFVELPDEKPQVTPFQELKECYDLVLKTARRTARDLRHAVDNINDPLLKEYFKERYAHFDLIFGGTSDYRIDLYLDFDRKEAELIKKIKELEQQLQEEINRSNDPHPITPTEFQKDIPF